MWLIVLPLLVSQVFILPQKSWTKIWALSIIPVVIFLWFVCEECNIQKSNTDSTGICCSSIILELSVIYLQSWLSWSILVLLCLFCNSREVLSHAYLPGEAKENLHSRLGETVYSTKNQTGIREYVEIWWAEGQTTITWFRKL